MKLSIPSLSYLYVPLNTLSNESPVDRKVTKTAKRMFVDIIHQGNYDIPIDTKRMWLT